MEKKKEKRNGHDVLVVRDEKTGEVGVVAGLNADGTPKRVPAKHEHQQDFLRFDRNSDMLDSFLRNFYRQCKEPTRFGFYRIAAEQTEGLLDVMKELLKDPEKNAELLSAHKVDTSAYAEQANGEEQKVYQSLTNNGDDISQDKTNAAEANAETASINNPNKQQNKSDEMEKNSIPNENEKDVQGQKADAQVTNQQTASDGKAQSQADDSEQTANSPQGQSAETTNEKKPLIDADAIDWQDIKAKYGVDFTAIGDDDRKALLNYGKTGLLTVKPTLGGETIEIQARLSFRKDADGAMKLVPHFVRNEPRLDVAYKGYTFTDEDKKSLRETGNLGKVVSLADASGEQKPCYVSVDRLTKEITDIQASKVRIPQRIGKTTITEDDRKVLLAGLPLRKEIELANGRRFSPLLQVNVEQRGVEFVPNSTLRNQQRQSQSNGQAAEAKEGEKAEKQQRRSSDTHWLNADGSIRKLATYFKIPLTEQQQNDYAAGKTIEIRNVPEKNGSGTYTAYVKFDMEAKRPKKYRENPDLSQVTEKTPTNDNKTQVAVNEQGKTNEATKNIKEPLKPSQTEPKNEKQAREQKPAAKRAKGVKV